MVTASLARKMYFFSEILFFSMTCSNGIFDGMLVFDYESGNLRRCPLYSLPELIQLGKTYE